MILINSTVNDNDNFDDVVDAAAAGDNVVDDDDKYCQLIHLSAQILLSAQYVI